MLAQAKHYRTNNVMFTMGMDFNYVMAHSWYKNMDKLVKYVTSMAPDVNVIYSTPSCYLKAVKEYQSSWPVKTDDFFPYASAPHEYGTGYFTSRDKPLFFGIITHLFDFVAYFNNF